MPIHFEERDIEQSLRSSANRISWIIRRIGIIYCM